ncbi:hypothetical protein [Blastococcus sp. VKM Ac-2987]|uniref:hypothetical protein n=1 Tax=Blastococcus sp. VKM Ac-2987 TaxID=3004141 RepID=UPI0022ABBF1B|nr:hypothetical protein [Blastococcus sp. VKM Ac-2987]MCZ2859126.1 hypothetical protein [Blastococcus sp. VKM Ac-2987]
MTAGQGDEQGQQGRPGEQGGQRPGWPPPPVQPPAGPGPSGPGASGPGASGPSSYGPGSQGHGQHPYGPPPYGYLPAPAAPTGPGPDAPAPVERPLTVRAGLGAFLAALVLSAVAGLAMVLNWDEVLDWTLAEGAGAGDPGIEGLDAEQFAELVLQFSIAFSALMLLLQALFVWFAWQGRNWARIVLWVLGGLTLVFAPFSAGGTGPLPFVTTLSWFTTALIAAGVVLLAAKPSNDWYRFRTWQFANGQR